MKMKMFCVAVLASTIGCAGLAQAATYTMDFEAGPQRADATGIFAIGSFAGIESASIDFTIAGYTGYTNTRGYSWYYSPNIDLSVAGTQLLDNHALAGGFTTLHLNLGTDAINYMMANQSLNFDILAQDAFWWSDLSPWGGTSQTKFYLDSVSLNVTPSAVPLPAAVWLFGSGVLGLIGVSKRRKAVC